MKNNKYLFQSKRLGFREWSAQDDLDAFLEMNADPQVMEYFPSTLSKEQVAALIARLISQFHQNGYTYYAVEVLETRDFIGMIGLAFQTFKTNFTPAIDIGWRLKKSAWGKGYATEGAKKCLDHAFANLEIDMVISMCVLKKPTF